uniref:Cadherin domain-containing protein n=1 Tax=Sinocyclocheilus anshuiensis TaxID=1608454 RepID=A0A671RWJ1_9TELE
MSNRTMARQVLLFIWFLSLSSALGQVSYSIPEEMAKGSLVGNIAQDLGLDLKRLKSGKARIYTGDSAEYIELNKERGVLLIKERIDREALCGQTTPCALHFQIILENPMEFFSVTIEITDINDNTPSFKKSMIVFRISEAPAIDLDVGINGLQSYKLKSTDNFNLKFKNQPGDGKNVEMVLKKPLDREKQHDIKLVLTAIDGGDLQLSGSIEIHITVLDVNDNAPVFLQSVYKATVTENAPKYTVVSTVSATDPDEGINSKIVYSIANMHDDDQQLFGINQDTGQVTVVGIIDFENARNYEISVQASDHGGLTDSCKIIVDVIDINDNKPVINIMSKTNVIAENSASETVVTMINVQDHDSGENGEVHCSINENIPFTLRSTNANFFSLVTDGDLDRERESEYNISVTCADEGVPSLSSSVTLSLQISDVNDNAPVFDKSSYEASVQENNTPGLSIFTVRARDADFNQNARVSYILEDSSVNGVDHGGFTDSCKIIVDAIDINDNKPVINIMSKTNVIAENSASETVVTMINVQDLDSGENGKVKCSVNENIPFTLRSTNANFFSLVTDGDLDRERESEYNISVTCADEGVPSLSSSVTLSLQISDVNDNAPVFDKSSYEASVQENNTPGLSIFTVRARDADFNQNARVSYILEDSSVNGVPVSSLVSVSADSGVIHAVRSFDYEQIKDFQFRVKAQDGGSPPLSSNVSVKIMIQDQNDNAPQVLYPVQSGASVVAEIVPRSADVGYLVTKVVAVDVDSGQNAWLSYKLQKATDRALFEVGLQNGEIRTVRQVTDKDAVKQRLTVVVEDNGQPSRSATVNVNVAVADSFPEVLSEFTDFTHDKDYNDNLTFYLVLALAVVSFLFIVSIIAILSVKCYRWRRERMFYKSGANLPVIPYYPPLYADVGGTGTLQHVYNYEVCRTTDSRKSDLKYGRPCMRNFSFADHGPEMQRSGHFPRVF